MCILHGTIDDPRVVLRLWCPLVLGFNADCFLMEIVGVRGVLTLSLQCRGACVRLRAYVGSSGHV